MLENAPQPQSPRSVRTGFVVDVAPDDMDKKMMTRDRKHQELTLKKKTKRKRSSSCCSNENDGIVALSANPMLQQQEQLPDPYLMSSSASSRVVIDCDDDEQQHHHHQQQHRVRLSSDPPQRITWKNPEQDLSEKQVLQLRAKLWYTRKEYTEFSNERIQTVRKLRALQMQRYGMHTHNHLERNFIVDSVVAVVEPSPPSTVVVRDSCCNTLPLKEKTNNNITNIYHDMRATPHQEQAFATVDDEGSGNMIGEIPPKTENGNACSYNEGHDDDEDGKDDNFCLRGLEIHLLPKRQYAQVRSYRNLYMSTILKEQKLLRIEHEERRKGKKSEHFRGRCSQSQQQNRNQQQKKATTTKIAWDFDRTHSRVRHLTLWAQERAQQRALSDPDEEFDKYYGKFRIITNTDAKNAAKIHFRSIRSISLQSQIFLSSCGGRVSSEQSLERMPKRRRTNSAFTAVDGPIRFVVDKAKKIKGKDTVLHKETVSSSSSMYIRSQRPSGKDCWQSKDTTLVGIMKAGNSYVPSSYALQYDTSSSFSTSRGGWKNSMQQAQHHPLMTPLVPPLPPQQQHSMMTSFPRFWHLHNRGSHPMFYNHYHHHDAQYYPSKTTRTR